MKKPAKQTVIQAADAVRVEFARSLRREQTRTEEMLWAELRGRRLGAKFRRQHPVDRFILDFYCAEAGLAVEIDGSSHENRERYDRQRDQVLADLGIRVLRVTDWDVRHDLPAVLRTIRDALGS